MKVWGFFWGLRVPVLTNRGCLGEQKLYANPVNKNAYKALIAAEYVGVKIEFTEITDWSTTKSPQYLAMNPMGKVCCSFSSLMVH